MNPSQNSTTPTAIAMLIIVLMIVVGGIYFFQGVVSSPLTGTVLTSSTGGSSPLQSLYSYALPELNEVPPQAGRVLEFGPNKYREPMSSIVVAEDGSIAYLGKAKEGWEVFVKSPGSNEVQQLTFTPTLKRDLQWLPGSNGLLFSELPQSFPGSERAGLDDWSVVEMLRTGEQTTIGTGVRPYPVGDRSAVSLTERGIIRISGNGGPETALISSPIFIIDTPITVSRDGLRIAWVSPSDHSIQVFEKRSEGTYGSVMVIANTAPTSIAFNEAGTHLLLATSVEAGTQIEIIDIKKSVKSTVGVIPGIADITAWSSKVDNREEI